MATKKQDAEALDRQLASAQMKKAASIMLEIAGRLESGELSVSKEDLYALAYVTRTNLGRDLVSKLGKPVGGGLPRSRDKANRIIAAIRNEMEKAGATDEPESDSLPS